MRTALISITALAMLGLTGCGETVEPPTPSPSVTESYGECVAPLRMDPNDPQQYLDQVEKYCGHLSED